MSIQDGKIGKQVGSYNSIWLMWEITEQDVAKKTSTLKWKLQLNSGAYGAIYSSTSKLYSVIINGQVHKGYTNIGIGFNTSKILAEGTDILVHDEYYEPQLFHISFNMQFDVTLNNVPIGYVNNQDDIYVFGIGEYAAITYAPDFTLPSSAMVRYNTIDVPTAATVKIGLCSNSRIADLANYRTVAHSTDGRYQFDFTEAELNKMISYLGSKTSANALFSIVTQLGDFEYIGVYGVTITKPNTAAYPTISPQTYDSNTATAALTGSNQIYIKGYSNLYYNYQATPGTGYTITSYATKCGGYSATTATGTVNGVTNSPITFKVTNTGKLSASKTVDLKIVNYFAPSVYLEQESVEAFPGNIEAKFRCSWFEGWFDGTTDGSAGGVKNNPYIQYQYKEADGTYGEWISVTDPTAYTKENNYLYFNLNLTGLNEDVLTYDINIRAVDSLINGDAAPAIEYPISMRPVFDWSNQDFNFNVPIKLYNSTIIRSNEAKDRTILSSEGGGIYLRPKGTDSEEGQILINNEALEGKNLYLNSSEGTTYINGKQRIDMVSGANTNITCGNGAFINLNGIVRINGNQIDYVKEQGDDGSYAYRIWNSGIIEAWRTATSRVSITTPNSFGSLYYSNTLSLGTTGAASQFVSIQSVQLTINKHGNTGFFFSTVTSATTSSGQANISYIVANPVQITSANPVTPYVYIVGRWK